MKTNRTIVGWRMLTAMETMIRFKTKGNLFFRLAK